MIDQVATDSILFSIVIPVYNERDTWRELVARVEAVALPDKLDHEVIRERVESITSLVEEIMAQRAEGAERHSQVSS